MEKKVVSSPRRTRGCEREARKVRRSRIRWLCWRKLDFGPRGLGEVDGETSALRRSNTALSSARNGVEGVVCGQVCRWVLVRTVGRAAGLYRVSEFGHASDGAQADDRTRITPPPRFTLFNALERHRRSDWR